LNLKQFLRRGLQFDFIGREGSNPGKALYAQFCVPLLQNAMQTVKCGFQGSSCLIRIAIHPSCCLNVENRYQWQKATSLTVC
jgi:hypothetical protein